MGNLKGGVLLWTVELKIRKAWKTEEEQENKAVFPDHEMWRDGDL